MHMPFRLFHIVLLLIALQSTGAYGDRRRGLLLITNERFHGRKSSSGRIHDKDEMVAAHRTHPFGTYLRVTNLENMKSVIVCVTDRDSTARGGLSTYPLALRSCSGSRRKDLPVYGWKKSPTIDLRWLELIYPKFPPTLTTEDMMPKPPYRMIIND